MSAFLLASTEQKYSNLCALCENPAQCNYPDKYSGYDGSIKCLVENGGDVAFTKVIYVRRFFGVSFLFVFPFCYTHKSLILIHSFRSATIPLQPKPKPIQTTTNIYVKMALDYQSPVKRVRGPKDHGRDLCRTLTRIRT